MAADERLRCWAAGVQVAQELEAAHENARHMLDLLQIGADPNSNVTFGVEAANYRLHISGVEQGIREAEACGESPIDLSWVGEFRRQAEMIRKPPTNEPDAHSQFAALDDVIDWLRRDTAGIPPPGTSAPSSLVEVEKGIFEGTGLRSRSLPPPPGLAPPPWGTPGWKGVGIRRTDKGDYVLVNDIGQTLTYGYFDTAGEAETAARKVAGQKLQYLGETTISAPCSHCGYPVGSAGYWLEHERTGEPKRRTPKVGETEAMRYGLGPTPEERE